MYLILLCFGTLFGLGAFFLLAGLLRLPTSASTKAVLTVTSRGKSQKGSINAILFDMAARLSPLVHLDSYKRKKLEAQLKSAEIKMSPETYIAAAWVKAGLIALLIIPALLIFPILAPVIVFLAVAVYFKEQKRADEIVQQRREEIEAELPRFVNTIEQELRASRDVLNILKSYQRNCRSCHEAGTGNHDCRYGIRQRGKRTYPNGEPDWKYHAVRCGARLDLRQARR